MKKKAIKIAASTAVAASAFVAAAPANKADAAVNLDQLVTDAQNAGTVLKWAISVEGSADYKTQPYTQYNAAKKAIAAAEKALTGASASDKLKYEARLTDPKIQVKRAQAYIDAITSSEKIVDLTTGLDAAIKSNDLDKVEAAYHKATAEYRKQAALLDRVYGQSTRDGIRNLVKPALEKSVADVKYEVTVHMLAKSAAADVKADKLEDAAKKLTEAQEYLDKNVKKWKTELQKSVNDVEASITLKALSVTSDNKSTVTVKFSKKIQAGAGVIPAGQFTFTNGLIVQSASVAADGKTVTLKTTDQKANTTYALSYQGVSTGLSFTTPASAVDNTISVVETEVANIDNGGERAYTVNVTKADGTAYTGKVKIELLAKATDNSAYNKSEVIVRSVNGQFVTQGDSTNPTDKAVYEVNAVNGKVTFVVKDNVVGNNLSRATKDVIPKITRVEDKAYKVAPKTTFWKAADAKQYNRLAVGATPTFDATNGFLYTTIGTEKVKFTVKGQDRFFINNTEVTKDVFFKAYSRQDLVSFDYNSDKNYVSTFRIDVDVTADAELEVTNPDGILTADTNATRLEGKAQPGHIIEVFKGTSVTTASHAVATTTVDANGNWVVNSLNLDAGVKNEFTVVARPVSSTSTAVQEKVTIYQGYYATVANGLVAEDTNKDGKFNIGDKLVFTFNYAGDLATTKNALKVADNSTITLKDASGYTRVYTVAKDTTNSHNTLVIKDIETGKVDNYDFKFGNTLIATSGITNQDNLVFNADKSVDKIVDLGTITTPGVTQGAVTYINTTAGSEAIGVGGSAYVITANTILKNTTGTILATGTAVVNGANKVVVGDQISVDGNVITVTKTLATRVTEVEAMITALPATASLTLADENAVVAAKAAYDALPAGTAVSNSATLTAAVAKIASLKAAQSDEAMVAAELAKVVDFQVADGSAVSQATIKAAVEAKVDLNKVTVAVGATAEANGKWKVTLTSKAAAASTASKEIAVTISADQAMVNAELAKVGAVVLANGTDLTVDQAALVKAVVETKVDLNKVAVTVTKGADDNTYNVKLDSKAAGASTANKNINVTVAP